jgi:GDP-mannose 6-dehydrogenase
MRISVFGIGYVGTVSAACLARDGHSVVAVDVNTSKAATLAEGHSPIVEPGLDVLVGANVRAGRLAATTDAARAIADTDLTLVCVGTPVDANGTQNLAYVERVSEEIGAALKAKSSFHCVVMRSTVLPGTMQGLIVPTLEKRSHKRAGTGFGIAYFPEFLRQGSAIRDHDEPGAMILGIEDDVTRDRLLEIYRHLPVEPRLMSIRSAEAVKYTNNAWHALKISFANEIGRICKAFDIDSHDVMEALCADTRLNVSPAYLSPGFAFGGSCLPKDLRALRKGARGVDIETPVLDAALKANDNQLDHAYRMIEATEKRRIGLIGLSFKPGTDDLRESAYLHLAERLIGRGYQVRIYDPIVRPSRLTGANRDYVNARLPHISELLLERGEDLVAHSDVLVIGNRQVAGPLLTLPRAAGRIIVDLVRVERSRRTAGSYHGICW